MSQAGEEKLLKTLGKLGIDLGITNPGVIEGWFDTDDKDVLDMLSFISTNLTEKNVLTAWEQEE